MYMYMQSKRHLSCLVYKIIFRNICQFFQVLRLLKLYRKYIVEPCCNCQKFIFRLTCCINVKIFIDIHLTHIYVSCEKRNWHHHSSLKASVSIFALWALFDFTIVRLVFWMEINSRRRAQLDKFVLFVRRRRRGGGGDNFLLRVFISISWRS